MTTPTAGERNNNPGNLRASPNFTWTGQTGVDKNGFCVFKDATAGIRALTINLHTHYARYDLTTVRGLITRHAPPGENNTGAYVDFVAGRLGVLPSTPIAFDKVTVSKLVRAIIHMKLGRDVYENSVVMAGVVQGFAHFNRGAAK
jgi:hypothetical protein